MECRSVPLRRLVAPSRSMTPPPKSAPPSNTYAMRAANMTQAVTSSMGMMDALVHAQTNLANHQVHDRGRQEQIDSAERHKRRHQSRHGGNRFRGAHHALDDPGLPANFGHHPAAFNGQKSQRRAKNKSPSQQPRQLAQ